MARAALDLEDDSAAQIFAAARRHPRAQHALRHGERAVGARVEHERPSSQAPSVVASSDDSVRSRMSARLWIETTTPYSATPSLK